MSNIHGFVLKTCETCLLEIMRVMICRESKSNEMSRFQILFKETDWICKWFQLHRFYGWIKSFKSFQSVAKLLYSSCDSGATSVRRLGRRTFCKLLTFLKPTSLATQSFANSAETKPKPDQQTKLTEKIVIHGNYGDFFLQYRKLLEINEKSGCVFAQGYEKVYRKVRESLLVKSRIHVQSPGFFGMDIFRYEKVFFRKYIINNFS